LIEAIEAAVELPENALPIDRYERYYTNRDGMILAVYIIHDVGHRAAVLDYCRTLNEAPFPCPLDDGDLRLVDAGQSTWVEDSIDMPFKSGGGCSQVNIEYSPAKRKFLRVECNGPL